MKQKILHFCLDHFNSLRIALQINPRSLTQPLSPASSISYLCLQPHLNTTFPFIHLNLHLLYFSSLKHFPIFLLGYLLSFRIRFKRCHFSFSHHHIKFLHNTYHFSLHFYLFTCLRFISSTGWNLHENKDFALLTVVSLVPRIFPVTEWVLSQYLLDQWVNEMYNRIVFLKLYCAYNHWGEIFFSGVLGRGQDSAFLTSFQAIPALYTLASKARQGTKIRHSNVCPVGSSLWSSNGVPS